ncbi:hypothetical protein G7Z17_g12532 [Cylindrodendrum hubeiense]|uniref:Phospholipase/carboxylesterase/thioesterase domain-containing protein n=1 Tax=Cylindrodendrum hubeiense TaxID=595255 RepID=A0A9P5GYQ2_9HYPO|nr:hypothetical protein G7Z17_g12532 [Cylindrodendrum hubeiense]
MDPDVTDFTIPQPGSPAYTQTHTHTVIFLHGRGDTARNFAASLNYSQDAQGRSLFQAFPSLRWVFPEPAAAKPGERSCQWFDIWNVTDFADREELQAPGLRASVTRILKVIEREAVALGGRWDRIVLAGISQGAATSVHTLLNLSVPSYPLDPKGDAHPRHLAAFLSFSARMPFPGRSLANTRAVLQLDGEPVAHEDVLHKTPMLLEHCVDDPLVLVTNGRILRDTLTGFGADVTWREYPDGGHWFNSPTGMEEAAAFLEKVLGIQRAAASASSAAVTQGSSDAMDID